MQTLLKRKLNNTYIYYWALKDQCTIGLGKGSTYLVKSRGIGMYVTQIMIRSEHWNRRYTKAPFDLITSNKHTEEKPFHALYHLRGAFKF